MASLIPSTPTPEDRPNTLVLYDPPSFEVIMSDAPPRNIEGQQTIHNPPEWLLVLHHQLGRAYEQVLAAAEDVAQTRQDTQQLLQRQYEAMRHQYMQMVKAVQNTTQITQEQIEEFCTSMAESAKAFAAEVWSTVARVTTDQERRDHAIRQLREVAEAHHATLGELRQELHQQKQHQVELGEHVRSTNQRLNDLLAEAYRTPNPTESPAIEEIRQVVSAAVAEAIRQTERNREPDADRVFKRLSKRAAAGRPLSKDGHQSTSLKVASSDQTRPMTLPRIPLMSGSNPPTTKEKGTPTVRTVLPGSEEHFRRTASRRVAEEANRRQEAMRAASFFIPEMTGALGSPPPPPGQPPAAPTPGADPDDSSSSSDSDSDDNQAGGRNSARREKVNTGLKGNNGPFDLVQLLSQLVKPKQQLQTGRPEKFTGRDKSKFKAWWRSIEDHMAIYQESFVDDGQKIRWLGTFLTDVALEWHHKRIREAQRNFFADTWDTYRQAIQERFRDPGKQYRDADKLQKLRYEGDIAAYLTRLQELNNDVGMSGVTLRNLVMTTVPSDVVRLVYSHRRAIPEDDEEFLEAIQDAGLTYEAMKLNPGLKGKDESTSRTKERSKEDQRENRFHSGRSSRREKRRSNRSETSQKEEVRDKKWTSTKSALQGIDQKDIDQFKAAKATCWRCGRDNHHTLECYAKKDANGKTLPQPPAKVSGTKRKAEDEGPNKGKRARMVQAVHVVEASEESPQEEGMPEIQTTLSDSDVEDF